MTLPRPLRAAAYGTFYRLPVRLRRRLVRLFVPKYVVGAVTLVHDSEAAGAGRLLLLRQPPGRGWGLPAGLLHRAEPPVVGAARELAEESGVALPPERLSPAVPNAVVHAQGWVDVVFRAAVPASTTRLVADGAEVLEVAWWPVTALPPLTRATAHLLGIYGIGPQAAGPTTSGPTTSGPGGTGPGETGPGGTGPGGTGPGGTGAGGTGR